MTAVQRSVLLLALLCSAKGFTMTCNVARPYDPANLIVTIPTFSRTRPDLIFSAGEPIEIFAFPQRRPLSGAWQLARNGVSAAFMSGEGTVGLDQTVGLRIPSERLAPGFYDLRFTIHSGGGEDQRGSATFGYRIDEIPEVETRPDDFDAFWAKGRQTAFAVPLNAAATLVRELTGREIDAYNVQEASIPENYDPAGVRSAAVKLYKVQFDAPAGMRMHGWLAVPEGPGPFPGMLVLPGAGCGKVPAPVEHARHGYVALMLQIHGMDVDQEVYEQPQDYLNVKGGRPEDEYFYRVYLACAQAVRYLAQRPDVDPSRLVTVGSSQGGLLAVVTARLCPEVTAVVSSLCYYGNWPLRDQISELNRMKADGAGAPTPPFVRADARQNVLSYYDPVNFAPGVKVPTLMCACLCDTPSPPGTVYAVYRRVGSARKALHWSAGTNHDWMVAFERLAWRWLEEQFGTAPSK
jgi:cephalosporin-C deacetylase